MKDLEDGKIQSAYMSDDVLYSLLSQFNKGHLKVDKSQEKRFSIAFSVSNHDIKLKKLLDSIIDTIDSKEIEKTKAIETLISRMVMTQKRLFFLPFSYRLS